MIQIHGDGYGPVSVHTDFDRLFSTVDVTLWLDVENTPEGGAELIKRLVSLKNALSEAISDVNGHIRNLEGHRGS